MRNISNDGKVRQVLYHEIGHAIDSAHALKKKTGSTEYSLRDSAVQPLIHKAYPGYVNYEVGRHCFICQKTGQRGNQNHLDREINQYFSALMVVSRVKHSAQWTICSYRY